ncbi:MAG TPA: transcription-repair coupling factor [Clostridiales bacterium]|nr:transcription-repair coupling factor [Clostridiales bacterium]
MGKIVQLTGISDISIVRPAARLAEQRRGQSLIVTPSESRAKRLAQDLSFFASVPVYIWPDVEPAAMRYEAKSPAESSARLRILEKLAQGESCIVIAPVLGALKKLPPARIYIEESLTITRSTLIGRDELVARLVRLGYERAAIAESPGQFAARGDIVDVFPPGRDEPYRIELFDEEVDSLRLYNPVSQRSTDSVDEVCIFPAHILIRSDDVFAEAGKRLRQAYHQALPRQRGEEEADRLRKRRDHLIESIEEGMNLQYLEHFISYFYPDSAHVWDHMADPGFILFDDPGRTLEALDLYEKELDESQRSMLERGEGVPEDLTSLPGRADWASLASATDRFDMYYCTPFAQRIPGMEEPHEVRNLTVRQVPSFNGNMDMLRTELIRFHKLGYATTIVAPTQERMANMREFLDRAGVGELASLTLGELSRGLEDADEQVLIISETDIFPHTKQRRRPRREKGREIRTFSDIRKGDYVVHDTHGIGQFTGVEKLTIQGSVRDYLKICYAGEDALYIPVDQMGSVQKYVGSDDIAPRVHRLSGGEWQRVKERARQAVHDMAVEFLELAAKRQNAVGYAFGEDSAWQKEFEDAFEFDETEDQLRAVEDIKRDMQSSRPMDRLLCGDVGYGKTEVAARAIFKCLEHGKQAVILAPTTLLANQHFHTLRERLAPYPFKVEMLSRFRTEKQQADILDKLRRGEIDLLIGTHRVLSVDVEYKDLGLLVVDEEQRFGVAHKEAIKRLKESLDVLTLSATPIPRTLHLSLIGVRDMSVIEEPPEDRYPVQTYVVEQDERLLADVVRRELGRDGQVFVVYNRVRGIRKIAAQFAEWIPEAHIGVGHGQMGERELEDVMIGFVEKDYDVLVSTTIIESGLDIQNANTIIILDADRLGLSQLYQLRGRVGRSNRLAYAYLVYKKDKVLSEVAEKRLRAIREFTEFGAGFRVAMRDLELRGAGNILGTEQSGHMMSVGYEMYCRLVEEVVGELRGEADAERALQAEASIELAVQAYLPESYVDDEMTRLALYKRISQVRDAEGRSDMIDELVDRFGDLPPQAENLLEVAMIHNKASTLGIRRIVYQNQRLVFQFERNNGLTPEVIAGLLDAYGTDLSIFGGLESRLALAGSRESVLVQAVEVLERMEQTGDLR